MRVGGIRALHPNYLLVPFCSPERLIRTCHRSNEYHLNYVVYGSEFGCRFNLCMCLSSGAWRGGWTESSSPNEMPASVTGWGASTRSGGFECKFWHGYQWQGAYMTMQTEQKIQKCSNIPKHYDTQLPTQKNCEREALWRRNINMNLFAYSINQIHLQTNISTHRICIAGHNWLQSGYQGLPVCCISNASLTPILIYRSYPLLAQLC